MLTLSLQTVNKLKLSVKTSRSQRLAGIILTGQGNMLPDTIYFSFLIWTFPCLTCQPTLPVLMYVCLVLKKTLRPPVMLSSSKAPYLFTCLSFLILIMSSICPWLSFLLSRSFYRRGKVISTASLAHCLPLSLHWLSYPQSICLSNYLAIYLVVKWVVGVGEGGVELGKYYYRAMLICR